MHIQSRIRSLSDSLNLAIQTVMDIIGSLMHAWRRRSTRPVVMRQEFVTIVRYYVGSAIDGYDCFPMDGDWEGRRPSELPPRLRRERRALADRRRRHVMALLDALGATRRRSWPGWSAAGSSTAPTATTG
ncbi:hypothetical protein [Micromonospora aurantiaca (nom. illeg.)]|uniref:hypothetical protein n=1 Tax=Micromonospora aurantiaca (nom. illeg.) TaxID=47850 RepID=UPI0034056220